MTRINWLDNPLVADTAHIIQVRKYSILLDITFFILYSKCPILNSYTVYRTLEINISLKLLLLFYFPNFNFSAITNWLKTTINSFLFLLQLVVKYYCSVLPHILFLLLNFFKPYLITKLFVRRNQKQ